MNLSQTGKTITGTARMTTNKIAGATVQGAEFTKQVDRVSGNMEGDDFYVTIGTAGIYRGKVGPSGRIDGTTYDRNKPSSKASWFSGRAMRCGDQASGAPPRLQYIPSASGGMLGVGFSGGRIQSVPAGGAVSTPKPGAKVITGTGKSATGDAPSTGVPRIIAFNKPKQPPGTQTLTWDSGPEHLNAEVWVKVGDEAETLVVRSGKGSREVTIESGKTYLYILKDAGQQLATDTAKGK